MENTEEILAARRDYDDKSNIQIHAVDKVKDPDRLFDMDYVTVSYKGRVQNLEVLTDRYPEGESPYADEVTHVPYLVIENRVYYIDEFRSLDMQVDDEVIIEQNDSNYVPNGVVYVEDEDEE